MNLLLFATRIRPDPVEASVYWWFIAAVVYALIAWLLWYDEKPEVSLKSAKGTHRTKKNKILEE